MLCFYSWLMSSILRGVNSFLMKAGDVQKLMSTELGNFLYVTYEPCLTT